MIKNIPIILLIIIFVFLIYSELADWSFDWDRFEIALRGLVVGEGGVKVLG